VIDRALEPIVVRERVRFGLLAGGFRHTLAARRKPTGEQFA